MVPAKEEMGPRIAVEASTMVNGGVYEGIFGFGLLDLLPSAMPEVSFFYHDVGIEPTYAPGENVKEVGQFEKIDVDQAFCIYPSGYFEEVPETLAVLSLDDETPRKSWWSSLFKTKDYDQEALEKAVKIVVPHQALRQALTDLRGIDSAKIHVVGYGLPNTDMRITPADSVTRRITKEVYGNEHSYFLAPATGHASDNLERLFAAYDLFRQRCKEPVRLLVEQPEFGKHSKSVKKAWKQAKNRQDIVFLPTLSQVERRKVVSSARAIVHPSLSTAFPLPVLDAWTAEVPVLGTNNKVMQGAGALVQGTDVKSIAEGMVSLVTTPFLASGLVENGKRRRQDFSWEDVAKRVAEVLRSV